MDYLYGKLINSQGGDPFGLCFFYYKSQGFSTDAGKR